MGDNALAEFLRKGEPTCPRCRHSLKGLSAAMCPECGCTLELRLDVAERRSAVLSVNWVLAWAVLFGASGLLGSLWTAWGAFRPVREMMRSLGKPPPSFLGFYFETFASPWEAPTACFQLAAVIGGLAFLILLRLRPGGAVVRRWSGWFCIAVLACSVAVEVYWFFET